MAERKRLMPTGECWCGCGAETKRVGSFFVPSHDRRAEAAVLRLEYGDIPHFLVAHGYGPDGKNPMEELRKLRERDENVSDSDIGDIDMEDDRLQVVVRRLIAAAVKVPGFRVDREGYLRKELGQYEAPDGVVIGLAVATSTVDAGIPMETLDKLADATINSHLRKAAGFSTVTGIPGGLLMAATIPADLAQFYWHALVCAQELAYLYGWRDLFPEGELELDEEAENRLILLLGALHGVEAANKGLAHVASQAAKGAAKYVPRTALAQSWYYPLVKTVAAQVGVRVTRQSFGNAVSKAVPLVGAAVSGGMTAVTFGHMAKEFKQQLRTIAIEGLSEFDDLLGPDGVAD